MISSTELVSRPSTSVGAAGSPASPGRTGRQKAISWSTVRRTPPPANERRRYQVVTCGTSPPCSTAAASSLVSRARTLWRLSPALRLISSQTPGASTAGSPSAIAEAYCRMRTRRRAPAREAAR